MMFLLYVPASGPAALCEGGCYTDDLIALTSCEDYQGNTVAAGRAEVTRLNAAAGPNGEVGRYELRDTLDGCAPIDAEVVGSLAPWMLAATLDTPRIVGRYRRIDLLQESDGFHASAGIAVHFGYCDTLDALKAEIDDHFAEEAEHYRDIDTPPDTPSLDTSFHDGEFAA